MASQRLNGGRPKRGPRSSARGKDQAQRPVLGERAGGTAPHATPTLLEYKCCSVRQPEEYIPYIGAARVDSLRLVAPLPAGAGSTSTGLCRGQRGRTAAEHSSLRPQPRARQPVVRAGGERGVLLGDQQLHHLLQGLDTPVTLEELFGAYLDAIDAAAQAEEIAADLVVVHDPQPAGLIMPGALLGTVLWRCHLDTWTPNPMVWRFLLPYIN